MVLFLCPIGVRKAHDADTATAIRNVSVFKFSVCANCMLIGAITKVVAVLFKISDSVMVIIIIIAIINQGTIYDAYFVKIWTIISVVPLLSRAAPKGITEAKRIITGHSTLE